MGLLDRLESLLERSDYDGGLDDRRGRSDTGRDGSDADRSAGLGYRCASCGNRFEEVTHSCPRCGSHELRDRSGSELIE